MEGMTITVEPMINAGKRHVKLLSDGWTVVTKDHSLSAQWEHTILVTRSGYEVLTLFVLPPSLEELSRRLRDRGTDPEDRIARRLAEARHELPCWDEFDHLVVNDEVAKVTSRVSRLVATAPAQPGAIDG